MALIETAPNSESCENNLRMACADEFAAINLYKDLKAKLQTDGNISADKTEEIIKRLDEIIKDEENHFGSLLYCINLLNPESMKNIDAGSKGA